MSLIFIHRPPLASSAEEQLLRNIEASVAEYERALLSDRMQRGRRYRLQQGETAPYPAPYGYFYCHAERGSGAQWKILPAQAQVVRAIYRMYVDEHLSLGGIARRLNEQNLPGPGNKTWRATTVGRILNNPAYKGEAYWRRHYYDPAAVGKPRRQGRGPLQRPRPQPRPPEEWIRVKVPAIVSAELWQQAQHQRRQNIRLAKRHQRYTYLLHGLLVCASCGNTLYGCRRKDHRYYYCPNRAQHPHTSDSQLSTWVNAQEVEEQIWNTLKQLLQHPQLIQQAYNTYRETQQPAEIVQQWQQYQQHLHHQQQRLIDAYQQGVIELEELARRRQQIHQELQHIQYHLNAYQAQKQTTLALDQFMERIRTALQSTDQTTQQELIRLLIDRIIVSDKELIIYHVIPTTTGVLLEHALR
ncbi:MAG: recombinase family protein, partial [Gammaproteobacteria bacterium]